MYVYFSFRDITSFTWNSLTEYPIYTSESQMGERGQVDGSGLKNIVAKEL